MRKIAYIIPGYEGEVPEPKIAALFKEHDIEPIFVEIDWHAQKPARFGDYVNDFLKVYEKPRDARVYVLGFSFGAVIAMLAAKEIQPDAFLFCSLSPYFNEDLASLPASWCAWWKKAFTESDMPFKNIASNVRSKSFVMVGRREGLISLKRAEEATQIIKDSELIVVKIAGHDIHHKNYMEALRGILSRL